MFDFPPRDFLMIAAELENDEGLASFRFILDFGRCLDHLGFLRDFVVLSNRRRVTIKERAELLSLRSFN